MRIASARSSASSILPRLRSPWVGAIQLLAAVSLLLPPGAVSLHADDPPGGPYTYPPASSVSYNYYMTYPEYFDPWVDDCNLINPDYSQGYTLSELLCTNAQGVPLYLVVPDLLDTNADGIPDVMADFLWLDPNDPDAAYAPVSGNEVYTIWEWYHAGQDMRSPFQPFLRWTGDMPNVWKIQWGVDPFDPYFATSDYDNDGLTGWDEYYNYTDPTNGDTDGDFYSDGDEIAGNSDPTDPGSTPEPEGEEEPPANQDNDGDGLDDHWEWEHGLSYQGSNRQVDTDGDGFSDYEEYVFNTSASVAGSRPTQAAYDALRAAGNGGTNGEPLPEFFDENVVLQGRWVVEIKETHQIEVGTIEWVYPDEGEAYFNVTALSSHNLLKGVIWGTSDGRSHIWEEGMEGSAEATPSLEANEVVWDRIYGEQELVAFYGQNYPQELGQESNISGSTSTTTTKTGTTIRKAQLRLAWRTGASADEEVTRTYLHSLWTDNLATQTTATMLDLSPSQAHSDEISLQTTTQTINQDKRFGPPSLAEIRQPVDGQTQGSLEHRDTIRLCRWLDNGLNPDGSIDLTTFPNADADRIVVRLALPDKKGQTSLKIKVSTEDGDSGFNDNETEINLTETATNSGIFESLPFVVVADVDDDNANAGTPGGADDASNDRTHIGQAGGKLVIKCNALGTTPAKASIKKNTHFFEVTSVILDVPGDDLEVSNAETKVDSQAFWMTQAYRPYGIEVHTNASVITVDPSTKPAIHAILNDYLMNLTPTGPGTDVNTVLSDPDITALKTANNIVLVYVNADFSNGAAGQHLTGAFEGYVLMSTRTLISTTQTADPFSKTYTAAHECGHGHGLFHVYTPYGGSSVSEPARFNLMRDGSDRWGRKSQEAGKSGRRLLREQMDNIKASSRIQQIP